MKKVKEIGQTDDVVKIIQKAMEKIDRGCQKAYVLQELFNGLSAHEGSGEESPVDNMLLLNMGVETILGEIVADNEEASECLLNLSYSKTLKVEVAA
jgi:hypothetical protein